MDRLAALRAVRHHRRRHRHQDRLPDLRPFPRAHAPDSSRAFDIRNFAVSRRAGGISVSRRPAESFFEELQQSVGGLGSSFGDLRPLAHISRAISELEVRISGHHRGSLLRSYLDENRIDLPRSASSRNGGHPVAHSLPLARYSRRFRVYLTTPSSGLEADA